MVGRRWRYKAFYKYLQHYFPDFYNQQLIVQCKDFIDLYHCGKDIDTFAVNKFVCIQIIDLFKFDCQTKIRNHCCISIYKKKVPSS